MAGKNSGIASLDASKNDWAIVARVIRLWSVHADDKSKTPTSREMILADVEGVRIHAIVRKLFVQKFDRVIKEGSVYSFRNFSITTNEGEYRLTKHAYKINIQGKTKVALLLESMVPLPAYVFTRFDEILSGLHDTSYLIDVIGVVTGVGNERVIERGGGSTKMNVIELENHGVKLTCSLWGAYAEEVKKLPMASDTGPTVVALFGVKIKEFQGNTTLQNSMHSTRIVFNPDFAEAIELKGRTLEDGMSASQVVVHLNDTGMGTLADDFLGITPRKTITELKDFNINASDGNCIVLGTIESFACGDDWWYLSCKCHRAVYPDSVAYYCNSCDQRVLTVTARYRIKITVVDETASANFVIFDRAASNLFKKECSEMINEFEKEVVDLECPIEIAGLVGEEYLFKVEVREQTSGIFEQSYRVRRLTKDADTLKMFKAMVKQVPSLPGSDLNGQCEFAIDGNLGQAGTTMLDPTENSIAFKKQENNSCKGKGIATPAKRNSDEVVDGGKKEYIPKLLKNIKIEKP